MGKYFACNAPLARLEQETVLPSNRGYMVSVHTAEWKVYANIVFMNYYSGCESETALSG